MAIELGSGYGVRPWLFCQNVGQLLTSYEKPQGMINNCLIQMYMNPDADTAKQLSERLCAAYADKVLAFSFGTYPASLNKDFSR